MEKEKTCQTKEVSCFLSQKDLRRRQIQFNFSHYLKSTRTDFYSDYKTTEMSQRALASFLQVSCSLIPKLESLSPYPRLYNSIEFLEKFAKLQNMPLVDFICLLEGTKIEKRSDFHSKFIEKLFEKISPKDLIVFDELLSKLKKIDESCEIIKAMLVLFSLKKVDRDSFLHLINNFERC